MIGRIVERAKALPQNENNVLVLSAVAVGILAGLGAIALDELVHLFTDTFLGHNGVEGTDLLRIAVAPIIGGLLVGPLVTRFASEAKGHGVPEVMEAVALRGGKIRGRVAFVKTLASAITIGSGGSAGREGPIVQIGATLGSKVGQVFKMSDQRVRILVGCGAAGGIAAVFNAPLAGVFFALEVILGRFTARGFATVVLSAVTSSVIWRARHGNSPVLQVPEFGLASPVELAFYIALGIAAAVVGLAFVRLLYWTEDRFEALPILDDLKPAIGAAFLGLLGVAVTLTAIGKPLIFGSGLPGLNLALGNQMVWWALLILLVGKMIGTSFSLGSGGSGGVFAPSLFMGAMLGGIVGQAARTLFPAFVGPVGAYALVGMAALFAGVAQAPIAATLIVFEMTNDYKIILPLMLSVIVATVVYSLLNPRSIYTMKLARKGVELTGGRERHLMERTPVRVGVVEDFPRLVLPATLEDARAGLADTTSDWLVAVDGEGRLMGVLPRETVAELDGKEAVLESLIQDVPAITRYQSLDVAMRRLAPRGLRMLPVIDAPSSRQVVGVVTRDSLMGAYWSALQDDQKGAPT